MSCPTITTIQPTECIGNSLNTINNNYQSLKTGVCDNQDQINTLRTLLYNLSASLPDILPVGSVIQTNYAQLVGNRSYTSGQTLPAGTTAPSITDGVEILRINGVATSSDSNYLIIDVSALISSSQGNITTGTVMLFAGNTLLASTLNTSGSNNAAFVRILFKHLPGNTSSVNYTVRAAVEGGTLYANRLYTVNDYNTGKQTSTMLIQEIKG
jgi:hypothetical protein